MPEDVVDDQLAIIKIEGMHCHKCEQTIQKALSRQSGVHEVEVDFNSKQASVLFDRNQANVTELIDAVKDAGYHVTGFTQGDADGGLQA